MERNKNQHIKIKTAKEFRLFLVTPRGSTRSLKREVINTSILLCCEFKRKIKRSGSERVTIVILKKTVDTAEIDTRQL